MILQEVPRLNSGNLSDYNWTNWKGFAFLERSTTEISKLPDISLCNTWKRSYHIGACINKICVYVFFAQKIILYYIILIHDHTVGLFSWKLYGFIIINHLFRLEICRDRRDRRSCKFFQLCNFFQKTTHFLAKFA